MDRDYGLENRKYVIGGVAVFIVVVYIIRLFTLQIMSDDYKKNADSNAFLKKVEYPARGVISDRNGRLLVYNQNAYDIMVVMNEEKGRLDTVDFCQSLGITKEYFKKRMAEIKDRNKNPGYSPFTQQMFMSQLSEKEFSVFQERYTGFPASTSNAEASGNTQLRTRRTYLATWQRYPSPTLRKIPITNWATT